MRSRNDLIATERPIPFLAQIGNGRERRCLCRPGDNRTLDGTIKCLNQLGYYPKTGFEMMTNLFHALESMRTVVGNDAAAKVCVHSGTVSWRYRHKLRAFHLGQGAQVLSKRSIWVQNRRRPSSKKVIATQKNAVSTDVAKRITAVTRCLQHADATPGEDPLSQRRINDLLCGDKRHAEFICGLRAECRMIGMCMGRDHSLHFELARSNLMDHGREVLCYHRTRVNNDHSRPTGVGHQIGIGSIQRHRRRVWGENANHSGTNLDDSSLDRRCLWIPRINRIHPSAHLSNHSIQSTDAPVNDQNQARQPTPMAPIGGSVTVATTSHTKGENRSPIQGENRAIQI